MDTLDPEVRADVEAAARLLSKRVAARCINIVSASGPVPLATQWWQSRSLPAAHWLADRGGS